MVLDLVECAGGGAGSARTCAKNGEGLVLVEGRASNWAVNGIPGGNSTVGTIVGTELGATYTAPASKPAPASVAVSAKATGDPSFPNLTVVANLTITDTVNNTYQGNVSYATVYNASTGDPLFAFKGQANVVWTLRFNDFGRRIYVASGTITGTYDLSDSVQSCTPVNITTPITGPFNELEIDTNKGSYSFNLNGDENVKVTTTCKVKGFNSTNDQVIKGNSVHMGVRGCSYAEPPELLLYSDLDRLSGTQPFHPLKVCQATSATWDFSAR